MTPQEAMDEPQSSALRKWQIAVAVLAVLTLTLLVVNVLLRSRADQAVMAREAAVQQAEQARADSGTLQRRNDELLSQLSTSNERLTELTNSLQLTKAQLAAADANVQRQVAAQDKAQQALKRARSAATRAAAFEAQLRNAQTCSAAAILAFAQIHAGPDVESGATEAADTLESVLAACRAGLK